VTAAAETPGGFQISLTNPVAGHWESFIFGNSLKARPEKGGVAVQDSKKCRDLVICGAGPSLNDPEARLALEIARGDVWGCNSALPFLQGLGYRVTHGFCIDQTPHTLDEWPGPPSAEYWLASSVHVYLTDYLLAAGRKVTFFHNFLGTPNERHLYNNVWYPTVIVGDGLNSVNRALGLAEFLGYRRITLLGADCALGPDDTMHANGDGPTAHGATPVILEGDIDGRHWRTKPDMLFSAVRLAAVQRRLGSSRMRMVGDTLPYALRDKSPDFLNRLSRLAPANDIPRVTKDAGDAKGRHMTSEVFQEMARVAESAPAA
jgi:hypothetical protein